MLEKIRSRLEHICEVIDQEVDTEQIYLFGSYAYGIPMPDSDLDLYVVLPDSGPRPVDAVKKIRLALRDMDMPLDIVACRMSVFEQRRMAPSLERLVTREGVLLRGEQQSEQRMA